MKRSDILCGMLIFVGTSMFAAQSGHNSDTKSVKSGRFSKANLKLHLSELSLCSRDISDPVSPYIQRSLSRTFSGLDQEIARLHMQMLAEVADPAYAGAPLVQIKPLDPAFVEKKSVSPMLEESFRKLCGKVKSFKDTHEHDLRCNRLYSDALAAEGEEGLRAVKGGNYFNDSLVALLAAMAQKFDLPQDVVPSEIIVTQESHNISLEAAGIEIAVIVSDDEKE